MSHECLQCNNFPPIDNGLSACSYVYEPGGTLGPQTRTARNVNPLAERL